MEIFRTINEVKIRKNELQEVRKYGKVKTRIYNGVIYIEQNKDNNLANIATAIYEALQLISEDFAKFSSLWSQSVLTSMVKEVNYTGAGISVYTGWDSDLKFGAETVITHGFRKEFDWIEKPIFIKHNYAKVSKPGIQKIFKELPNTIQARLSNKPFTLYQMNIVDSNGSVTERFENTFQIGDDFKSVEWYPETKRLFINGTLIRSTNFKKTVLRNMNLDEL